MNATSTQTAEHYTWGDRCDGWHLVSRDEWSVIQERMPPRTSETAHHHTRSRQFFYVPSGTLALARDDKLHLLGPEQGLEVAPYVTHRAFNDTDTDVRFLVVSVPPSHADRVAAA